MIIISISEYYQVPNKPMGFLPQIQKKGQTTMRLPEYNPIHNSIDINHYGGYIIQIDFNYAETRTTPNSQ